jgi:hypothetical protein
MCKPPKEHWGCLQWGIMLLLGLLVWIFIASFLPMVSKQGTQMRGVMNCKNIIRSLKLHAKDNGSAYPDAGPAAVSAKSANQIFHRLFIGEIITASDERIFGCPNSMFVPDGDIGTAPDFAKALTPGECHWMLLKFQTDFSSGDMPVVVENALNATWPPQWDVSDPSGSKRGRVWKGNKIIIGRNDGSVAVERLSPDGTIDWRRMNNSGHGNKSWIDTLSPEQIAQLSYWDIEEK